MSARQTQDRCVQWKVPKLCKQWHSENWYIFGRLLNGALVNVKICIFFKIVNIVKRIIISTFSDLIYTFIAIMCKKILVKFDCYINHERPSMMPLKRHPKQSGWRVYENWKKRFDWLSTLPSSWRIWQFVPQESQDPGNCPLYICLKWVLQEAP